MLGFSVPHPACIIKTKEWCFLFWASHNSYHNVCMVVFQHSKECLNAFVRVSPSRNPHMGSCSSWFSIVLVSLKVPRTNPTHRAVTTMALDFRCCVLVCVLYRGMKASHCWACFRRRTVKQKDQFSWLQTALWLSVHVEHMNTTKCEIWKCQHVSVLFPWLHERLTARTQTKHTLK